MTSTIRAALVVISVFGMLATSASGQQKPTADQATPVLIAWYKTHHQPKGDLKAHILKIGEIGKGDFAAPGSQDPYWPVEFTVSEAVGKMGPIDLSTTKAHAVGYLWQDKLGNWKIGKMEELPIDASPPSAQ